MAASINLGTIALHLIADVKGYAAGLASASASAEAFAASTVKGIASQTAFSDIMVHVGTQAGLTAEHLTTTQGLMQAAGISAEASAQTVGRFAMAEMDLGKALQLTDVAMAGAAISSQTADQAMGTLTNSVLNLTSAGLDQYGMLIDVSAVTGQLGNDASTTAKQEEMFRAVMEQGNFVVAAHSKALAEASEQTKTFNQYIEQNTVLVAAAATAMVAYAGVVTKGLAEATKYAARTEVTNEVLQLIAENAGKSAKQVDQLRDRVKDLGTTTQVANQALIRMIQYELDLSKATELANVARNAAVIADENTSETLDKLVYGITTLNTRLLRNRGIMINLNHEYARYAEQEGKIVGELTVHDRHQAALNAVLREGAKLAGAYERAMGFVGKTVTSLPRLQEEFNNALGQHFIPIMEAVVNTIWKVLEGYTLLEPKWQKMIAFTLAASTALTALAGALLLVKIAIPALTTAIGGLGIAIGWPIAIIAILSLAIGGLITVIQEKERAIVAAQEKAIELGRTYEAYTRILETEAVPATRHLEEALYEAVRAEEMAIEKAEEMQAALLAWAKAQEVLKRGWQGWVLFGETPQELDERMRLLAEADPLFRALAVSTGRLTPLVAGLMTKWELYDAAARKAYDITEDMTGGLDRATHSAKEYQKNLDLLIERVPWLRDKVFELSFTLDHELGVKASKAWYKLREDVVIVSQEVMDTMEELGLSTRGYAVATEETSQEIA